MCLGFVKSALNKTPFTSEACLKMNESTQVVWFKRDLRVHDHHPLVAAAVAGRVLPLYILEPEFWRLPDSSRRHWHFIYDSLLCLQRALADLGAPLIIRVGPATEVLNQLRRELGVFDLWSHEESGNHWTFQRDLSVAQWCKSQGIVWHEFPTNGVVRRLKSRDGWARQRDATMSLDPVPAPAVLKEVPGVSSHELPDKNSVIFGRSGTGYVQAGGRTAGLSLLSSFLKERGRLYMQAISKPGISARHCSRLSAHITFGTLSLREVEHATRTKILALADNPEEEAGFFRRNLSAFMSRLAWHCHFIQKLEQQPEIEFKCMHPAFEAMREDAFNPAFFAAWQEGVTGYPLVDACMRSLHKNGWITFRMRAMLVSFASYDLWLDWRRTAPFMAQLFTDYEPGIHYSQFQMQSGVTGINAVRIYNPIKQSYDQDPQGKFIRRYVPELRGVPDIFIHEPWLMTPPPAAYPKPIVDHELAIQFARSEISRRWKQEGFGEQSDAINKKLGSRNRPADRRQVSKKDTKAQLTLDL